MAVLLQLSGIAEMNIEKPRDNSLGFSSKQEDGICQ